MTNAEGVKPSNILIRDKKIRKIIGKTAPIWTKEQLKDRLTDELKNKNDKVTTCVLKHLQLQLKYNIFFFKFQDFLDYLSLDLNLIVDTKEGFIFVPDLLNDMKNTPIVRLK